MLNLQNFLKLCVINFGNISSISYQQVLNSQYQIDRHYVTSFIFQVSPTISLEIKSSDHIIVCIPFSSSKRGNDRYTEPFRYIIDTESNEQTFYVDCYYYVQGVLTTFLIYSVSICSYIVPRIDVPLVSYHQTDKRLFVGRNLSNRPTRNSHFSVNLHQTEPVGFVVVLFFHPIILVCLNNDRMWFILFVVFNEHSMDILVT